MFTISRTEKFTGANSVVSVSRHVIYHLILGTTVIIGSAALMGCGQKGGLYLVDSSSQTVESNTPALDSTSNPQDAAFAGIDDNDYQKERYLEQKQVLPEPSNDPNDY